MCLLFQLPAPLYVLLGGQTLSHFGTLSLTPSSLKAVTLYVFFYGDYFKSIILQAILW